MAIITKSIYQRVPSPDEMQEVYELFLALENKLKRQRQREAQYLVQVARTSFEDVLFEEVFSRG